MIDNTGPDRIHVNIDRCRQQIIIVKTRGLTKRSTEEMTDSIILIIEIDGGIHKKTKIRDQERDEYFMEKGYRVLRIKNEEVFNSLKKVLERIKAECEN